MIDDWKQLVICIVGMTHGDFYGAHAYSQGMLIPGHPHAMMMSNGGMDHGMGMTSGQTSPTW